MVGKLGVGLVAALLAASAGSGARTMRMQDVCTFRTHAEAAFCDTFDHPFRGGRAGDLDPARWTVARVNGNSNVGQGMYYEWFATTAQYCQTLRRVVPDHDSFVCGPRFGEASHWMTAMNDGGAYAWMSARILQPFDFAGRTGTLVFDVDAKTAGSHSWWPEVWIADQPVAAPHGDSSPGVAPRNAIGFRFADTSCVRGSPAGKTPADRTVSTGGLDALFVVNDYEPRTVDFQAAANRCYRVQADHANHFEIRLSQNRVEVWASDFSPDHGATFPHFRRVVVATGLDLPFTRGYVSLEQTHYNAEKSGVSSEQTYHWHGVGFDGPVLLSERASQVPDALAKHFVWPSKTKFDGYNLGYRLDPTARSYVLRGVDLAGAKAAWLSLTASAEGDGTHETIQYRLNSGPWRKFTDPKVVAWGNTSLLIPIARADLVAGTNRLQLRQGNRIGAVANIDVLVDP